MLGTEAGTSARDLPSGKFGFVIRSKNNHILATSRSFFTEESCRKNMDLVRSRVDKIEIVKVSTRAVAEPSSPIAGG